MIHELKTRPQYYRDVVNGSKRAELRYNDRCFNVGDTLVLAETDELGMYKNGNRTIVRITHILHSHPGLGLLPGWCVLSFEKVEVTP